MVIKSDERRIINEAPHQTDASGRFVLFLPRLPQGDVELDVEPPDDTLDDGSLRVEPGARDVLVRLGGMRELRLHVVDETGRVGVNTAEPRDSVQATSIAHAHSGIVSLIGSLGHSRDQSPDSLCRIQGTASGDMTAMAAGLR